jgi:hypothetical protein
LKIEQEEREEKRLKRDDYLKQKYEEMSMKKNEEIKNKK